MRPALKSAIITILIVQAIVLFVSVTKRGENLYQLFGTCNLMLGALGLIPGLGLACVKQSRALGQGILIGCGIMLLIGFAICSNLP
jgi:hypothetical protein